MANAKTTAFALAAALAVPGIASAQDAAFPISANVAFTTDYVFRGISQTDEKFAVQGGFDWTSEPTGIYLGTWASNVDFNSDTSVELDAYVGWAKTWTGTVVVPQCMARIAASPFTAGKDQVSISVCAPSSGRTATWI